MTTRFLFIQATKQLKEQFLFRVKPKTFGISRLNEICNHHDFIKGVSQNWRKKTIQFK